MRTGDKIKSIRELRNYTQQYICSQIKMSLSGYSKIERNETDVSISRLQQIAQVLEVDLGTILDFDKNKVFNLTQNQHADGTQNGYTVVENQQILSSKGYEALISQLKEENTFLRSLLKNHLSEFK